MGQNDSGAVLDGHGARRRSASNASVRSVEQIAYLAHADRLGPRFRLPSVNRRHPSSVGMGRPLLRLRACRKGTIGSL
jgi:hypothetical protein